MKNNEEILKFETPMISTETNTLCLSTPLAIPPGQGLCLEGETLINVLTKENKTEQKGHLMCYRLPEKSHFRGDIALKLEGTSPQNEKLL